METTEYPGLARLHAMLAKLNEMAPPTLIVTGPTGDRMYRYARDSRWHTCRRGRVWRKGPRF